jgi:hypothetical protein
VLTGGALGALWERVIGAVYKGLGTDSEEKQEPVSDIATAVVDSQKVLDPNRPIREADMDRLFMLRCEAG